jgi:anaerobic magnesium-protoporphyrin IX monomethyl ester cyclase
MRVLLLHPQVFSPGFIFTKSDPRRMSLGLLYIASVLEIAGHEVCVGFATKGNIHNLLKKFKPQLIGFSVITADYLYTKDLVKSTKKENPEIKIVLGGYHPTFLPDEVLKETEADFVIRGEGENAMSQLVTALEGDNDLSEVNGLSYKRQNMIVHNDPGPMVDVDTLPFPAREKIEIAYPVINESRGCPYHCTFCCIQKFYCGTWRPRKIENLISELLYMKETLGYRKIHFQADNFLVSSKRIKALCNAIIENGLDDIHYSSQGRIDKLAQNPDLIDLMIKAGWKRVTFGLESGVQQILDNTYNKQITLNQVVKVAKKLSDTKMYVGYSFIIGSGDEYETEAYIKKSINFLRSIPYDGVTLTIFTPFPGTTFFQRMKEENRILTYNWDLYDMMHCVYKPKYMSSKKLEEIYSGALLDIYENGGFLSIIKRTLQNIKVSMVTPTEIFNLSKLAMRMYARRRQISQSYDFYADKYYEKIERLCKY